MKLIVTLSLVALCFSYTEAQFPIPGNFIATSGTIQPPPSLTVPSVIIPPSLKEAFTTAYILDAKSWADFDVVFNVSYIPADAAVVVFNFIYSRAVDSGMDRETAWSDARAVSLTIYETIAYLTPQSLAKVLGYIYFDQLVYGNVLNAANTLQLAQSLSDTYKYIFSKPITNNIQGIFDASKMFLTPYNLYSADALKVKDQNIVKYFYLISGVPRPVQ